MRPLALALPLALAACAPKEPAPAPPPADQVAAQQEAARKLGAYEKLDAERFRIPIERSMDIIATQGIEYPAQLTNPKAAPASAAPAAAGAPAGEAPAPFSVDAGLRAKGEALFTAKTCSACHSLDGSRLVGPSLKGFWGRATQLADGSAVWADAAYFTRSLKEPNAQISAGYPPAMPPLPLSEAEIEQLLHYVASL